MEKLSTECSPTFHRWLPGAFLAQVSTTEGAALYDALQAWRHVLDNRYELSNQDYRAVFNRHCDTVRELEIRELEEQS